MFFPLANLLEEVIMVNTFWIKMISNRSLTIPCYLNAEIAVLTMSEAASARKRDYQLKHLWVSEEVR